MIQLAAPSITDLEKRYINEAIDSTFISGSGKFVNSFSKLLATRTSRKFALPVANGTVALELILRAMKIGDRDEVIVPAMTFAATANAVISVGARPVFVDVLESSWCINPAEVKAAITKKTKAIIAVNLFGNVADYNALAKFGIPVIEDAAQSHGSSYYGRPSGSFGTASTFSFHANKTISTGEGGAVLTDSEPLYEAMKLISNHGMSFDKPYIHVVHGSNFKMTNVTAAIGTAQMERWEELCGAKRLIERMYDDYFRSLGVGRIPTPTGVQRTCWLYAIESAYAPAIHFKFQEKGINSRLVWPALTSVQPFLRYNRRDCPVSERLAQEIVMIPTWSKMPPYVQASVAESGEGIIKAVYKSRN